MKRTIVNFTWEHPEAQNVFVLEEVVSLLEQAGFKQVECFQDLERNIATKSEFGVFICHK